MSTTPRTDEQTLACRSEDGSEMVHASFAAKLEAELITACRILNDETNRAEKAEAELVRFRAEKAREKEKAKAEVFFSKHPEHLDGVKRAHYAYHVNHREAAAHYFSGSCREAKCRWCGQTREGVRWDWYGTPPTCAARPQWADESLESVIHREEVLFEKVVDRANKIASEMDVAALTGAELSILHHTHGVDPSMLEVALLSVGKPTPSQAAHDEYLIAMQHERDRSKSAHKKEIVSVRPEALL